MSTEFNWDDMEEIKPVEQSQDSSFDWDQLEEVKAPERTLASVAQDQSTSLQEDISKSRSALVGAGQGMSFGFADELTAPFVAAAGMTDAADIPSLPDESTWEKYQRLMQTYRDTAREEQKSAQEQNPMSYLGGSVAGGLAVPLGVLTKAGAAIKTIANPVTRTAAKIALGAGTGGVMGGLAGAGEAEGTLQERLPEAIEGAEMGAMIGGAIPLAGTALKGTKKFFSGLKDLGPVQKLVNPFEEGLANNQLVTKPGVQKAEQKLFETSQDLYSVVKKETDEIGKQIGEKIKQADETGAEIDLTDDINGAMNKFDEIIKSDPAPETLSYIKSVKSELNQMLGIKPDTRMEEFLQKQASIDKLKSIAPEGMSFPKLQPPEPIKPSFIVSPSKAQEIKTALYRFTPKNIMDAKGAVDPLKSAPARIAEEVRAASANKLETAIENISNEDWVKYVDDKVNFGQLKESLKKLIKKESIFEDLNSEKINDMLKKIDSAESGKSRRAFEDIIGSLKDSNPEAATALEKEVLKNVKTFTVGKEIQTGGLSGSLQGTARSIFGGTANLAGLAARKTGLAATANLAKNFTSAVLDSKPVQDSIMKAPATIVTGAKDKAPHDLQRQVAKAAENAEPEFLNSQADQIRQKYGNQGEQLAVILNNMANKDKNARRALMFTVLQNTVYRKMLGLQEE